MIAPCLLAALVVGCSETDGRTLPPADPAKTTTTPSTPVIQSSNDEVFRLLSTAFVDGGTIPDQLTCRGAGVSPELSWTGTPEDAVALAIVARDRDAGGFVHWIVTGIEPSLQGFGEGGLPETAVEGPNSAGGLGWTGPCPPDGTGIHTYEIQLLALPSVVIVPAGSSAEETASLLEVSAGERAVLTGTVTASDTAG
jgi:Raf kinase inhibitor-like YbhB/YbcL family protein